MNRKVITSLLLVMMMALALCPVIASAEGDAAADCEVLGHDWGTDVVLKEGDCQEKIQSIIQRTCNRCHVQTYISEYPHEWVERTVDATCTEPQKVGKVCNLCNETDGEMVELGDPLGHEYHAEITKQPTCTEAGEVTNTCTREGCTEDTVGHSYTDVLPLLDHTPRKAEMIEATCTESGKSVVKCDVCEKVLVSEDLGAVAPPTGHTVVAMKDVAATCKTPGSTGGKECSVCHTIMEKPTTLPVVPDNHNYKLKDPLKPATCTATGIGKYTCEYCDASKYATIPASHSWNEGEVEEEGNCGKDGKKVFVCMVEGCGATKTEVIKATGKHTFESGYIKATCTEPEKIGEQCTVCFAEGKTQVVEGSKPLGHDMVTDTENKNYKAATCTKGGLDTRKCSRCDYTDEKATASLGHKWNVGEYAEADCENAAGVKQTCETCGETQVTPFTGDMAVPPTGHDYVAVVTEPTCKEGGYTTHTCKKCDHSYTDSKTNPVPDAHVPELEQTLKQASCTVNGIGKYVCKLCKTNLGYKTIEASHNWNDGEVTTEATCGKEGEKTFECTACGKSNTVVIPATGEHDWKKTTVDATCTEPEKVGKVCTICNEVSKDAKKVEGSEPLGHDYDWITESENKEDGYKAATCKEEGFGLKICKRCDWKAEAPETIPALQHDWPETGTLVEHDACRENGGIQYTCQLCGETKVVPVLNEDGSIDDPKDEHKPEVKDIKANCTEPGYTGKIVCSVCGEVLEEGTKTNPDGKTHVPELVGAALKEPTCTTTGIGKYACKLCKKDLGYKTMPADHTWNDGEVTTEANCGKEGVKTFECTVCGEPKTEAIPATGKHTMETDTFDATCVSPAKVGEKCSVCGAEGKTTVVEGSEPLGHRYDWITESENEEDGYKAAWCEEEGFGLKYCTECDWKAEAPETIPALGHDWDKENATWVNHEKCSHDGGMRYACKRCGNLKIETLLNEDGKPVDPKDEHKPEVKDIPANCKNPGYTGMIICSVCGETLDEGTETSPDKNRHIPTLDGDPLKEPTCTTTGIGKYKCNLCEVSLGYKTIPADHTWNDGEVTTEANCGKEGVKTFHCTVTDCHATKTEVIPATGEHDWKEETVDATCTEPAKVGKVCRNCEEVSKDAKKVEGSEPLGHDYAWITESENEEDGYKAATCEEEGFGLKKCTRCDWKAEAPEIIPALGHDWDKVNGTWKEHDACRSDGGMQYTCKNCDDTTVEVALDANGKPIDPADEHKPITVTVEVTCTKPGYTGRIVCSVCGEVLEKGTETNPDGKTHVPVPVGDPLKPPACGDTGIGKYQCELCKKDLGYKTIPAAHTWDQGTVTTPATCGEEGEKTLTCTVCGAEKTEAIPATGEHTFEKGSVDATCLEPKKVGLVCPVCGATEGKMELVGEALGHNYVPKLTKEPTCTEAGEVTYTCARCSKDTDPETVPALGHTRGETDTVKATCTENGKYVVKCTVCYEILEEKDRGEEDPATGHKEVAMEEVAATCQAPGSTGGKKCSVCGEILVKATVLPVDPEAHNYTVTVLQEDICDKNGIKNGIGKFTCACGKTEYKTLPHGYSTSKVIPGKAATCTEPGLTEGKICTACGQVITAQEEIPALGHTSNLTVQENKVDATCKDEGSYDEVVYCSVCYAETSREKKTIEKLTHTEEVIPAKEATCTEAGLTEGKKCSACGQVITAQEEIPALGHTPAEAVRENEVAATCNVEGSYDEVVYCSVCNAQISRETKIIEKLAHTEEVIPGKAATCTEAGLTDGKKCSVCGEILLAQEEIEATGHTEEVIPGKAATCTEAGLTDGKKCSVCGEILLAQEEIEATGHTEELVPGKDATCAETGLTGGVKCPACGEIFLAQEEIPKLNHTPAEAVRENEVAATCKAEGSYDEVVYCSVCEAEISRETKPIDKVDHTEEVIPGKEATCTEAGLTEGVKCPVCGNILFEQEEIPALGHTPAEAVRENEVAATCKAEGSYDEVVYCSVCEAEISRETKPIDKVDHTEEVVPGKAATCTEAGLTDGKKCSVCGEILLEQEEIEPTGHTEEVIPGKAATCTEAGLTDGKKCSVCGEILLAQEEIEATGHTEEVIPGKAATCTETGLTDGKKCSVCEEILLAQEEIEATRHTEEVVPGKDATCSEIGLTDGVKCPACGEILLEQEEIPALGHTPAEAVRENEVAATCKAEGSYDEVVYCSVCEAEISRETKTIDKVDHTEAVVAGKAATCTEAGLTDGVKCSVCGEILLVQEEIEPTGHTEEVVPGKAATCTEAGLTDGKKCSVCGEITVAQEEIEATGHTEEVIPGKAATCTEAGLTDGKKCSVCGEITVAQEEIEATGHTEEVIPGKAATCTEAGLTDGKKCSVCSEITVAQEEIEATGHTEEVIPGKAATCIEAGLTDGKKCSVCGEITVAQEEIAALGHTYVDGVCSVCGEKDPDYVPPHVHSYTKKYSFNDDFTKRIITYTCACGDSYTVEEDY